MPNLASWIRRGLRFALRPANPLAAISVTVGDLTDDFRGIAAVTRGAVGREQANDELASLAAIRDPHKRFAAVMRVHRMTEADLPAIERAAHVRFATLLLITSGAIAYATLARDFGLLANSAMPLVDELLPWGFVLLLGALTVRASFWLFQIRRRALLPFRAWLARPSSWLDLSDGRGALVTLLIGSALLSLAPTTAMAQAAASGISQSISDAANGMAATTHANDLSLEWLRRLFPGAADIWGGAASDTDTLKPLFQLLNSALMGAATAVLAFHVLIGTVSTAHEGKILGQRWHQIWAPIRVCAGVGLLVPIKGYCVAQLIVIQVLFAGYSLANSMWALYVEAMLSPTSSATVVGPRIDVSNVLAARLLQAETCAIVVTTERAQLAAQNSIWNSITLGFFQDTRAPAMIPPAGGVDNGGGASWDFGQVCGAIKMPVAAAVPNAVAQSPDEAAAFAAFDREKIRLLGQFVADVRATGLANDLANTVLVGGEAPDAAAAQSKLETVLAAAAAFNDGVTQVAKSMAASLDTAGRAAFKATAADLGWASAGAMNFTLTRLSANAVDHAAGAQPDFVAVDPSKLSKDFQASVNGALANLAALIRDTSTRDYVSRSDVQVREDFQSWNPFAVVLKPATDAIAKGLADSMALNDVNPMSDIMALGNATLTAGETAFFAFVGLRATAATTEKALENGLTNVAAAPGAGVLAAIDAAAPFVDLVVGGLMIIGAIEAYVVPLVPFLMWFFAVMACAALAAEAVVAAPLAALLHIRMDGQELIDQHQRPIYLIVFNAALRPTLLLFGLILSNVMFAVMAGYVNKTFSVAMLASQGNNIIGIVGVITMMTLLLYLHYQLAVRCMSLVHQVPSMVSHILGAPDGSRGEAEHAHTVIAAVGGMVRSGGSVAASRAFTPRPVADSKIDASRVPPETGQENRPKDPNA